MIGALSLFSARSSAQKQSSKLHRYRLASLKIEPRAFRAWQKWLRAFEPQASSLTLSSTQPYCLRATVQRCKMGDELLDFFDLKKPFQRVVIAGGQSRGKIKWGGQEWKVMTSAQCHPLFSQAQRAHPAGPRQGTRWRRPRGGRGGGSPALLRQVPGQGGQEHEGQEHEGGRGGERTRGTRGNRAVPSLCYKTKLTKLAYLVRNT